MSERQNEEKRGPDFLCIGAQKSATTWLNWNLRHHPDIWMPPCKEVDYFKYPNQNVPPQTLQYRILKFQSLFNEMIKKQQINMPNLQWLGKNMPATYQDDEWYLSLFDNIPVRIKGDVTPSNAKLDRDQVAHAAQILGSSCKIIYFLRNPVERTWSQICQDIRMGFLKADFNDIEVIKAHIDSPTVNDHSDYVAAIEKWSEHYPDIHLEFFDDVKSEPLSVLKRVCDLVDVEFKEELFSLRAPMKSNETQNKRDMPEEIGRYIFEKYEPMLEKLSKITSNPALEKWKKQ